MWVSHTRIQVQDSKTLINPTMGIFTMLQQQGRVQTSFKKKTLSLPLSLTNDMPELEEPPAGSWSATTTMERVVYKTRTVSRRCTTVLGYVNGNTANMLTHIRPHHPMCRYRGWWMFGLLECLNIAKVEVIETLLLMHKFYYLLLYLFCIFNFVA